MCVWRMQIRAVNALLTQLDQLKQYHNVMVRSHREHNLVYSHAHRNVDVVCVGFPFEKFLTMLLTLHSFVQDPFLQIQP